MGSHKFLRAGFLFLLTLIYGGAWSSPAQTLSNGGRHVGTTAGGTETWNFTATAGGSVMLRVGATNFPPRIRLFDGSNVQIAEVTSPSTLTRDVVLSVVTTNSGNYTVLVNSATAATGGYALYLAQAPTDFTVPTNDEGGTLASGVNNAGNGTVGDLDMWRFTATAGSGYMLRMGGTFTPWIRVYNPSGALVGEAVSPSTLTRDVVLSGVATNAGVYTVVTSSTVSSGVGAYTLHLALARADVMVSAGDQGGDLVNGAKTTAENILGDLDVWRFTAAANDMVHLRMGGAFTPWIRLYGPGGELVGEAVSPSTLTRDVLLERRATNAGVYVVVTSSTVASGVGAYELTLARVPADFTTSAGDEGGALVNGASTPGNISVGDLDMWRIPATAGDAIILRMGGAFTPKIQLYGPDGAMVEDAVSPSTLTRDVTLEARAATTGTYVAIASSTVASGAGVYTLHLAQLPEDFEVSEGDQGGEIVSGPVNEGELTPGDLDLWSFEATAGESFYLRIGAEFAPRLRVYGPDGALAGAVTSPSTLTRDLALNTTATNAGTYVVVVDATVSSGDGTYDLHLVRGRGGLEITAGDEGGALVNGATNRATLTLGDLDAWTFFGTVGDSNVLRVTATNFAPWIRLYGPAGTLVAESLPPSTATRSANLIYELTANPGEYTVVVSSGVPSQQGTYAFKQSRWAPDLNVPQDAAVDEGDPVLFTITSQDPDEPTKPLQFQLLSAPSQATFEIAGATNATIAWSTSEADGPVTNTVVVKVTDVVNGRSFSRTNSFDVVVREINLPPVLTVPTGTVVLNELTPIEASVSATDPDLPANPLTFSLVSPPTGMTINPTSGVLSWIPTENQGPFTGTITVVVTDSSPFAANEKNLSTTNTFAVDVREVNVAPQLTLPPNLTVDELVVMNASALATDADFPTNTLTFALQSAPPGMTILPGTGAISWTPTEAQGPGVYTVIVRVSDGLAVPPANWASLSTTNSFTVTVREVNVPPVVTVPPSQTVNELEAVTLQASATDADAPTNALTFSLLTPPEGMTIASSNGVISWTSLETQGGTTNIVRVVVADSNPDAASGTTLSATNSFTLIVAEVNVAPQLAERQAQTIAEMQSWTFTNSATDADLPAQSLSYSLASAPTNATISAAGVISWTPTEAQGPGTVTFTTIVTDDGSPGKTATNTFSATVTEVNSAPTLTTITNQTVRFGFLWTNRVSAVDDDLPANQLTYSVEEGPNGLVINPTTGALSWTPVEAQVGTHNVRVRATDDGTPAQNGEMTFQILVTGEETRLEITRVGSLMQITINGNVGLNYRLERSGDLTNWEQQSEFRLTTSPQMFIDPDSIQTRTNRNYRLRTAD
jgi:hypothetical protein